MNISEDETRAILEVIAAMIRLKAHVNIEYGQTTE